MPNQVEKIRNYPPDWRVQKIANLGNGIRPIVKAGPFGSSLKKEFYADSGYKIYGQEQVISGDHTFGDYYIDEELFQQLRSCEVVPGDILMSLVGTVGKVLVVPEEAQPGIINPRLLRLSFDQKQVNIGFAKQWLESPIVGNLLQRYAQGGTIGVLNAGIISELTIPLPSLDEQDKIAEILSNWDNVIAFTETLIAAHQQLKNGLMQKLLTGERRFSEFREHVWDEIQLGDFLKMSLRKIQKPSKPYMALGIRSHGKGTFQRLVENPEDVAMTDLYQVKTGDLILNITFAWEGAIALVNEHDDGCLVSHRFPTYRLDETKVLPDFFRYLMVTKRFFYTLGLISPGGAGRNRVLNKGDFLKIKVRIPSIEEQERIGSVLCFCDKQISLLKRKYEILRKQKRGLMQRLLTGEVRVKV